MNNLNSKFNHFNLNNNVNTYFNINDNQNPVINNQSNQDGLSNSTSQLLVDVNAIQDRLQFLTSLVNKNSINQQRTITPRSANQLMITCKGQITNHLEQSTELRIIDNADQLITGKVFRTKYFAFLCVLFFHLII